MAETCELAVDKLKYEEEEAQPCGQSPYFSFDPAPALPTESMEELRRIYLDPKQRLFKRYQAMFTLRNMNSADAVAVLVEGFRDDSALFRHEIGIAIFLLELPSLILRRVCFGTNAPPGVRRCFDRGVKYIISCVDVGLTLQVLRRPDEYGMVRHEVHLSTYCEFIETGG